MQVMSSAQITDGQLERGNGYQEIGSMAEDAKGLDGAAKLRNSET